MPPDDITNLYSDKELVQKIKENSDSAFKLLFTKYYNPLINFCFYRIRTLDVSKDLVQEIFTRLWISRNNLDPEKSIKSYLYKSAVNQIINFKKHSSSKNLSFDESISTKEKSNITNLENQIDLFSCIENLPEKLKTVFMLSRVEGLKYPEIAEICGISVKAVEKRMTKAFKTLRKVLSN
jgi:RNA polymerase sigma-70 factor (ECF subfamily)